MQSIVLLFLLASSIGLTLFWMKGRRRARATAGWTAAQGRILSSHVERSRGSEGESIWAPRVSYVYSVGGRELNGERVDYGGRSLSKVQAEAVVRRYPVGKEVEVLYDSDDPRNACLEHARFTTMPLVGAAVGLLSVVIFGFLFLTGD